MAKRQPDSDRSWAVCVLKDTIFRNILLWKEINMIKMYRLDEQEKKYLDAFLKLNEMHRNLFDKGNPNIPVKFSELICMKVLGLEKYKGRDYDAMDKDKNTVEIKGTCMPNQGTTFSCRHIAQRYIWFKLDPSNQIIEIIELDQEKIKQQVLVSESRKYLKMDNIAAKTLVKIEY